ncbi:MAG TPA: tRNA-dihydrouridine synthase family protein [Rhodocyclaceae bacterium]
MEGLADDVLREILTGVGGFDWCVSEFARVSSTVLPARFFRRIAPELDHGARTQAGVPVRVQLLGADPARMAGSAQRLAQLDPWGIDLNFGCPTPTVNRHRGGACLLDEPDLLFSIAAAVRQAVPVTMVLSAKMRLGVSDPSRAVEVAQALVAAGVGELAVHARTRADMYRHPARWEWIGRIREAVAVPVVANGDIRSVADWQRCRAITGCDAAMLGRGAVADPLLARRLKGSHPAAVTADDWPLIAPLLADFWVRVQEKLAPRHAPGRIKHWLSLLAGAHPEAARLYAELRPLSDVAAIGRLLDAALAPSARRRAAA